MTTLEAIITIQGIFVVFPCSNSLVLKLSMRSLLQYTVKQTEHEPLK